MTATEPPSAPTFLESLGQIASSADAGPRLDVGQVTAAVGARVTVDLAGDGTAPVVCNKLRAYTPAVGEMVLVVVPDGAEPVVLGSLGDLSAAVHATLGQFVNVTAWEDVTANRFQVSGNAIRCVPYDGAIRWGTDGALEIANRDGTALRGVRMSRLHANTVESNGDLIGTNVWLNGNAIRCVPYDGAIRFGTDGALEVANWAGTTLKGIRTSRLHANDIDSNGDINALAGIRANGGLSCGGNFLCQWDAVINGSLQVDVRMRSSNYSSVLYDGAIRWGPSGHLEVKNYAGNFWKDCYANAFGDALGNVRTPGSERSLKDEVGTPDPSVIDAWRPALFTWKPDAPAATARLDTELDTAVHAAVYVNELDDTSPGTVLGKDEHGNRIPDVQGEIAYLVAAVQDLRTRLAAVERERDELRDTIESRLTAAGI